MLKERQQPVIRKCVFSIVGEIIGIADTPVG